MAAVAAIGPKGLLDCDLPGDHTQVGLKQPQDAHSLRGHLSLTDFLLF